MNKTDLENKILSLIELNQGLKGTDLVLKIMSYNLEIGSNELMDTIFDLLERGEMVEIEYQSKGRNSKSFLVPKGTTVNVINKVRHR